MVRLKGVGLPKGSIKKLIFQFHYGTIKSMSVNLTYVEIGKFQFHYGTIKRNNGTPCNTKSLYFNSTMVRLKEYLIMEKKFKVINFNSTMVRLKESDFCEMLYD